MQKLQLLFVSGLFITSAACFAQDKQVPYFIKTYQSSEIKKLIIRTSGGEISVVGSSNDETRVEVYVQENNNGNKRNSTKEIENRLNTYEISVKKEGETISCIAKQKNQAKWKNELSISFKVYTPENISIDLGSSGGSILLRNLTGNLAFTTSGGSLKLQNLEGNIKGRTSGGSISILGCRQQVDVATSGGSISAEDCEGNIKLSTSGGSLTLKKLDGTINANTNGGGIKAEKISGDFLTSTSGGSIRLVDISASLKATTSGGSIDADIESLGKYLSLSTNAGNIRVKMPINKGMDLDLNGHQVRIPTSPKFNGVIEKNQITGSWNGGGIAVYMNAKSGGVYINE